MLHLLDANVLIDASRDYYPMDRVPEFREWLVHVGKHKKVKIPLEIYCELEVGNDQLSSWLKGHKNEMLLHQAVSPQLVAHVINQGYADDLSDEDIEKIGQDPFLVAYAVADVEHRRVVTTELRRHPCSLAFSATGSWNQVPITLSSSEAMLANFSILGRMWPTPRAKW